MTASASPSAPDATFGYPAEGGGVLSPGEWSVVERAVRAAAEALIEAEPVCVCISAVSSGIALKSFSHVGTLVLVLVSSYISHDMQ